MRFLLPAVLLLASCSSRAPAPAAPESALFVGQGRDRLCLSGPRAGLIAYGQGDRNCSVSGTATRTGDRLVITPAGDSRCRIEALVAGATLRFLPLPAACGFYCAPGASLDGKRFERSTGAPSEARDFAGDPLC